MLLKEYGLCIASAALSQSPLLGCCPLQWLAGLQWSALVGWLVIEVEHLYSALKQSINAVPARALSRTAQLPPYLGHPHRCVTVQCSWPLGPLSGGIVLQPVLQPGLVVIAGSKWSWCWWLRETVNLFLILMLSQATGLDAWASRVKCPARFVSYLHEICI